jgi:phosphoribosyl 1,2-cyclic phosphate phosphodiesterase
MRLRFLGTGAAEAYPVLFCACDDCETARARGGKSIRRRSALMVDDDLMIDFGPDIGEATRAMRLPLHRLEHLLLTHAHGDHLSLANFDYHRPRWTKVPVPTLHVYGSDASLEPIRHMKWTVEEMGLELHPVMPGQVFAAGRYQVTALPARHAEELQPLFYAVERDARAFLYATDTGIFLDDAWTILDRLAATGTRFDAAIVEGTMGFKDLPPTSGHLNVPRCAEHHQQIRARGLTRPGCLHLATHFSPGAGTHPHEETAEFLAPYGVEPAYDGLEIDLTTLPAALPTSVLAAVPAVVPA